MGILLFVSFFVLLLLGTPIALAIGIPSFLVINLGGLGTPVIAPNFFAGIAKFPLLAIPLFILAGFVLERCGISEKIIHFANLLFGQRAGGLVIVAVAVCVFFGGVSGSGPADAAAIGAILIPAMYAQGYSKSYSASLIAAAGSTAIIVPPSIALIIYGAITNTSIPALFAAGAVPGLIAGLAIVIPAFIIARRKGYGAIVEKSSDSVFKAFREAFWGLMAPVIILGGLYGGIFTPTEAAVVAVFYSLMLGFVIYRSLTIKMAYQILVDASEASAVVMLIVAFAGLFSWAGSTVGILDDLAGYLMGISSNEWVILFFINALIFVGGMLMDAISIYYIFLPIFLPIMSHFNWDPVWFGVVMTFNLAIGQFTPPVAVNLYVTTQLADIPLERTFRSVLPLVAAMLIALIAIIAFPWLSLFVPRFFGLI
jgi:tripartite ATP-independent transporter DctM subunit